MITIKNRLISFNGFNAMTLWPFVFVRKDARMAAYKNISFEREAYANQHDVAYTDNRKSFAWIEYIKL